MIVVYDGKNQTYLNISHSRKYLFRKGVPTYVKDTLSSLLDDSFTEYDSSKKDYNSDRIYIELPIKTLEFFLASLKSVRRIKENFPTCSIECYTRPEWSSFLPQGTNYLQSFSPKELSKYYRQFNFNEGTPMFRYKFRTPNLFKQLSYEQLILQLTGMWDPKIDKKDTGNTLLNIPKSTKDYILLQYPKFKAPDWIKNFHSYLENKKFEVKVIHETKVTSDLIELLNNSVHNFIIDPSLAYLSGSLGTPTVHYSLYAVPAHWVMERFKNFRLLFQKSLAKDEVMFPHLIKLAYPTPQRIEINVG